MAKVVGLTDRDEVFTQLATRIPRRLHRAMKLHCVQTEQALTRFVTQALGDKLAREERR